MNTNPLAPNETSGFLTVKDVAFFARFNKVTIYRLVGEGKIHASCQVGRNFLFDPQDFGWMRAGEKGPIPLFGAGFFPFWRGGDEAAREKYFRRMESEREQIYSKGYELVFYRINPPHRLFYRFSGPGGDRVERTKPPLLTMEFVDEVQTQKSRQEVDFHQGKDPILVKHHTSRGLRRFLLTESKHGKLVLQPQA